MESKVRFCEICASKDHKTMDHKCKICQSKDHTETDDDFHPECVYCKNFPLSNVPNFYSRTHKFTEHMCTNCRELGHERNGNCKRCTVCHKYGHDTEGHQCSLNLKGECKMVSKNGKLGYGHDINDHKCSLCGSFDHTFDHHPCDVEGCTINGGFGHGNAVHRCYMCNTFDHPTSLHKCTFPECKIDGGYGHDKSRHKCEFCDSMDHVTERHMCLVCGEFNHDESSHDICECKFCGNCAFCSKDHCSIFHTCSLCTGKGHECNVSDREIPSTFDGLKAEIYLLRSMVLNLANSIKSLNK